MSREQQELNRSGNINYICKSYSIMNDLIIKILAHEKTIIIYMNQQILRKKIQDFLYTCSTSPQFMCFVELNKEKINEYMRKNNLFQKRQHQNFSQKDMIKTNVNRYVGAFKLSQLMNQPDMIFRKCDYIFTLIGMSLNTRAFLSTIQLLGTQQQINKWQELVLNGKAFGSYGQTELGHGSNVQGMETQALYDQKKQTFILKSPKITSSKYWPGALGMVCTHTVLQARTFVRGQSIGLQTFIIQIRDQNLQTKKGVKSGDIGPKFGYHRVDNGYLILQNVQIPRESMLMKYVKVTPQGQVLGKENKEAIKYAYGSMLQLRVTLPFILSFNHIILPANQLYGIYQRLGINNSNEQKFQLINHLSIGIGIILSNMYSQKLYNSFLSQMKAKNYKKADKILAKCHIISATFKTLTSENAVRISRDIAVGNNFSIFRTTGIPYSYNYIVSSVTYEGDNSVLFQQIARYILKQNNEQLIKPKESQINNSNMNDILNVFRYVSSMQVKRINGIIKKQLQGGIGMNTIWNERRQKEIIQVARFWGITQIIEGFIDTLNDVSDPELKNYFYKAGKIFIKSLMKDAPQIFLYGFNLQLDLAQLQFSNEQFWALTHIERPMFSLNEEHQLIERPGNWIKSKL